MALNQSIVTIGGVRLSGFITIGGALAAGGGGGPPAAHAPTHENGGSDPITLEDLSTDELGTGTALRPDGFGGVSWVPFSAGSSSELFFGAAFNNIVARSRYAATNGEAGTSNRATLSEQTEAALPRAGSSFVFAWNTEQGDATTVFKVWADGLVVDTITITGLAGTLSRAVALSAGALIAVEYDTGTPPRAGTYSITVDA